MSRRAHATARGVIRAHVIASYIVGWAWIAIEAMRLITSLDSSGKAGMVIVEAVAFALLCPVWVPIFMVGIPIRAVVTGSAPEPAFFFLGAAYLAIFVLLFCRVLKQVRDAHGLRLPMSRGQVPTLPEA
jgi:hypothetical protein